MSPQPNTDIESVDNNLHDIADSSSLLHIKKKNKY